MCMTVDKSRKQKLSFDIDHFCIACFKVLSYVYDLFSIHQDIEFLRFISGYYRSVFE